jgi:hypothetical protein
MDFLFIVGEPEELTVDKTVGVSYKQGSDYFFIKKNLSLGCCDRNQETVQTYHRKKKEKWLKNPKQNILFVHTTHSFSFIKYAKELVQHICIRFDVDYFTKMFYFMQEIWGCNRDVAWLFKYYFLYFFIAKEEIIPSIATNETLLVKRMYNLYIEKMNVKIFPENILVPKPF